MQLLDDLRAEHDLIEQVAGSLQTYVLARRDGSGDPADAAGFMAFFRRFTGDFHHDKEEWVLFQALVEKAELPAHRGPLAALTQEHARMGGVLEELGALLTGPLATGSDRDQAWALTLEYTRSLWRHIDAENSVVFPEGAERLRRFFVKDLPSRPMRPEEAAARAGGERLVKAYPPRLDKDAPRGEGCVACPSYGTTCDGLEREWWTDLEWEDMKARMNAD